MNCSGARMKIWWKHSDKVLRDMTSTSVNGIPKEKVGKGDP